MGAQVDVETPPRYQLLCCGLSVNNDLFTPVSVHNKFQILCINGNFHFRKNFVSFIILSLLKFLMYNLHKKN